MAKQTPPLSLAQRMVTLHKLHRDLRTQEQRVGHYHVELVKKISKLADVEGFNVSLVPTADAAHALEVTWSCEKRRDGIDAAESREIGMMIGNIEAVGFKLNESQHDTHAIVATFRLR